MGHAYGDIASIATEAKHSHFIVLVTMQASYDCDALSSLANLQATTNIHQTQWK